LIQPLDRANQWYRYHTLLAGTLLGELRRLEPGRERELNLAASSWHEDHGDPERAIAHAVAAHDPERLGELLLHQLGRQALGPPPLTLLGSDRGGLEGADACASRARRQAERRGLGGRPIAASLFAASALVRAARGRVADAMADVRHSRRLLEELTVFAPW